MTRLYNFLDVFSILLDVAFFSFIPPPALLYIHKKVESYIGNPTHQTQEQTKPTILTVSVKKDSVLSTLFNLKKSTFTPHVFLYYFLVVSRSIEVEMILVK